jgi:hypothetical protein
MESLGLTCEGGLLVRGLCLIKIERGESAATLV